MAQLDRHSVDQSELPDDEEEAGNADELADEGTAAELADEQKASEETSAPTFIRTPPPPEVLALGRRIVDVLIDRQAADVVLLDISPMASFADYFVIATGNSERQLLALRDSVD